MSSAKLVHVVNLQRAMAGDRWIW